VLAETVTGLLHHFFPARHGGKSVFKFGGQFDPGCRRYIQSL
jgi:hypothetical protein